MWSGPVLFFNHQVHLGLTQWFAIWGVECFFFKFVSLLNRAVCPLNIITMEKNCMSEPNITDIKPKKWKISLRYLEQLLFQNYTSYVSFVLSCVRDWLTLLRWLMVRARTLSAFSHGLVKIGFLIAYSGTYKQVILEVRLSSTLSTRHNASRLSLEPVHRRKLCCLSRMEMIEQKIRATIQRVQMQYLLKHNIYRSVRLFGM